MRDKGGWLGDTNIRAFELFCAIYEEQSVTKAANVIGISQSSASKQLSEFRKNLEDVLFTSSNNTMIPTKYCKTLYPHFREVVDKAKVTLKVHKKLEDIYKKLRIRIVGCEYFMNLILPRVMDSVSEYIDDIYIDVMCVQNTNVGIDHAVRELKFGRVDFIVHERHDIDDMLKRKILLEDRWIAIRPCGAEMENIPYLGNGFKEIDNIYSTHNSNGRINSFNGLICHVRSCLGFSVVPERMLMDINDIEKEFISEHSYNLYLYWRPERSADRRAELFRKALLKECHNL